MHDPVLMLSEAAKTILAQLEREWRKHYREKSGGKGWRTITLAQRMVRQGICESNLHAWQVLEELDRAELIIPPQGTWLSPRTQLRVTVELAGARCAAIMAEVPAVDERLGLASSQGRAWERALQGPLGDWCIEDQLALAESLRRLADDLPDAYRLSPYVASARYLLGSSKLLEALPIELVRAFGIDPAAFQPAETWLLASVPEEPDNLLLVENAQSFTQACRIGIDRHLAIVCTFGYGLSLGRSLKGVDRVRLVGQGVADVTLPDLLRLPNPSYWGDLDPEGLRIYLRLRQLLPQLKLSALMAPMMAFYEMHGGHPLDTLSGKAGQRAAGDWQRGLDQEWLEDAQLAALAGQALDPEQQVALLARLDAS
jgi:hypothetical protein